MVSIPQLEYCYTFGADPLRCLSYGPQFEWGGHIYYTLQGDGLHFWAPLFSPLLSPSLTLEGGPQARGPLECPPAGGYSPVGPKYNFTTGQLFDQLTGTYEHTAAIKVLGPFSARQTVDID